MSNTSPTPGGDPPAPAAPADESPAGNDIPPDDELFRLLPDGIRAELERLRDVLAGVPGHAVVIATDQGIVTDLDPRDDRDAHRALLLWDDQARRAAWLERLDDELSRHHVIDHAAGVSSRTAAKLLDADALAPRWQSLAARGVCDRCRVLATAAARHRG